MKQKQSMKEPSSVYTIKIKMESAQDKEQANRMKSVRQWQNTRQQYTDLLRQILNGINIGTIK